MRNILFYLCMIFIMFCLQGTGWEQHSTPNVRIFSLWLWELNYLGCFSFKDSVLILVRIAFGSSVKGSSTRGKRPRDFATKPVDTAFTLCFFLFFSPILTWNFPVLFIIFVVYRKSEVPTWVFNTLLRRSSESKTRRVSARLHMWENPVLLKVQH